MQGNRQFSNRAAYTSAFDADFLYYERFSEPNFTTQELDKLEGVKVGELIKWRSGLLIVDDINPLKLREISKDKQP